MTEQSISSTTHYQQLGNSKKSWNTKSKKRFGNYGNSEEEKARIKRDRQVIARLNKLGYKKGDSGNLPCFCGKLDEDTAWWMSNCKSRTNHLFCPRCTERVFEPDIKKTLTNLLSIWKKSKMRMWKEGEVSLNQLLSKGKDA